MSLLSELLQNETLSNIRFADIVGDGGDNLLTGTPNADVIEGRDGNDTLLGLEGDDLLSGGNGNDSLPVTRAMTPSGWSGR